MPKAKKNPLLTWRTKNGLSIRKASAILKCSRGAIGNWEAKPKKTPGYIILAMKAVDDGHTAQW